jgi:uncharacterized protein (TIGR02145 family)
MKTKNRIWIFHLIVIVLVLILTNSCKKQTDQGQQEQPPVLVTVDLSGIKPTTANSGGDIASDGGATVTARGVCWSTTQNPTTADTKTTDGTGTGFFISVITGLIPTTTYYVRAYATNSAATSYGKELSFKTYTGTIPDVDGNVYNTETIGTQIWMAENLKTTKYGNGDLIGTTTSATLDITGESTPKYQWIYDGNQNNLDTYGRLYTWYAVTDSRGVCPTGWHLPSDAEWNTLINYSGGANAGDKLKETGTIHWLSPNTGATNETGFTALPSGMRYNDGTNGIFKEFGSYGDWWSTTEHSLTDADGFYTGYTLDDVSGFTQSKYNAYAVRCLKD